MKLIASRSRLIANRRTFIFCIAPLVVACSGLSEANAQFRYGRRGLGTVIVPTPVIPSPYFGRPWGPPPVVDPLFFGPPASGVRIRTPFFSMNLDAGGVFPPAYSPPAYSASPYRYDAYRPSYGAPVAPPQTRPYGLDRVPDARIPDARTMDPRSDFSDGGGLPPENRPLYRPGPDGGLPALTDPPGSFPPASTGAFSMRSLADAADLLRRSLLLRRDDSEIWSDYLQPRKIIEAARTQQFTSDLIELRRRYDGVVMNPELRSVARSIGFNETRQLLGMWVDQNPLPPQRYEGTVVPSDSAGESSRQQSSSQQQPSDAPADSEPSAELVEPLPSPVPDADRSDR